MLKDSGHDVEIVTSSFNHEAKEQFEKVENISGIKVAMIDEPGYSKNICLRRFYSHSILAKNVKKYLDKRKIPDVVYSATPSLSVAQVCAEYSQSKKCKFIIDIQDLWPEAFKMVFNVPLLSDFLFYPMMCQANKIYSLADEIIAVSKTYADRAMSVNKKIKKPHVIYLGTDSGFFEGIQIEKHKEEFVIGYVGRLSDSYDLNTVINAIGKTAYKPKLLIMGDGPKRTDLEKLAKDKKVICEFTGMLPYEEMIKRLSECSVAVNPIRKGSAGSIINKVSDYAMVGLPVINTQECIEYREILESYNAGINCKCEDVDSVKQAIMDLMTNSNKRFEMAKNSKALALQFMDRKYTYRVILDLIKEK